MGNGVINKMIKCCNSKKDLQDGEISIEKNTIINYKLSDSNNQNINEEENQHKNDQKVITTKSKQSSVSLSLNKGKKLFMGDNNSNKDPNVSICINTFKLNNSNLIKNNLVQNNINNNNKFYSNNPIEEMRYKNSLVNCNDINIDMKTKLILTGDLFSNKSLEIDKYGMKNGLRQKHDGLTIFGIKEDNDKTTQNSSNYDYYLDLEKIEESGNAKLKGKIFEIYLNKINKKYTLYFLNETLILYYKINNNVFFDTEKDYYLILGDIFLTIQVKKSTKLNEKTIHIQAEVENEKPKKYSFTPKETPIKIGRVNCHITIEKPSISKLHSIIDFMDDNFYYKDCESTNGSTLLIREDDTLNIKGEMSFKLEDISFKIKEVDDNSIIEENN
jgi:hypothetical protein